MSGLRFKQAKDSLAGLGCVMREWDDAMRELCHAKTPRRKGRVKGLLCCLGISVLMDSECVAVQVRKSPRGPQVVMVASAAVVGIGILK